MKLSIAIVASFLALPAASQTLRYLLARGHPVFAIARNVLVESVRLKISLVFIVLLVFFLAGLPFFLDPAQPLRYRVQMFLTYGTGGAFWTLALLTVLLAGCAGQQQVETAPARPASDATLKVVNGTASDVRVEADGRALGDVPAGREQGGNLAESNVARDFF